MVTSFKVDNFISSLWYSTPEYESDQEDDVGDEDVHVAEGQPPTQSVTSSKK